MANFTENSIFEEVRQLATVDAVLGGPGGISNIALQQLTNRTRYLFDKLSGAGLGGDVATFLGDLNTFTTNGLFLCRTASTNKPITDSGILLNASISSNPDASSVRSTLQVFVSVTANRFYWRMIANGVVQAWKEVLPQSTFTTYQDTLIGMVAPFAYALVPSGWLLCNGAAIDRSTYAKLFAKIGVTYGSGDGSTTFNVPELRAEFVRGLDIGRGVDIGRVLGSAQSSAFEAHTHDEQKQDLDSQVVQSGTGITVAKQTATITQDSGSAGGAAETRPRNVAMLYCIYSGA